MVFPSSQKLGSSTWFKKCHILMYKFSLREPIVKSNLLLELKSDFSTLISNFKLQQIFLTISCMVNIYPH